LQIDAATASPFVLTCRVQRWSTMADESRDPEALTGPEGELEVEVDRGIREAERFVRDLAEPPEHAVVHLADLKARVRNRPRGVPGLADIVKEMREEDRQRRAMLIGTEVEHLAAHLREDKLAARIRAESLASLFQKSDLARLIEEANARNALAAGLLAEPALRTGFHSVLTASLGATLRDVYSPLGEILRTSDLLGGASVVAAWAREFDQLAGAVRSTDMMLAALNAIPRSAFAPGFGSHLLDSSRGLASVTSDFYADVGRAGAFLTEMPTWLRQSPVREVYTGTRAGAAATGAVEDDVFDDAADDEVEAALGRVADELEGRLAAVHTDFLESYRGAARALESRPPDWVRHFFSSVRMLVDALLKRLAPSHALNAWDPTPSPEHFSRNQWTRKAQLRYIYREVRVGKTLVLAEGSIDMTLATFFPADSGVHELIPPFTEVQARVVWRHVQGEVSKLLEAAGY
jgi:hypothetical protein